MHSAGNPRKFAQIRSSGENRLLLDTASALDATLAIGGCPDNEKHPPTSAVSGCLEVGATGLEPVTPSVSSRGSPDASEGSKGLAESDSPVCTPVCGKSAEPTKTTAVESLADALRSLTLEDRARLAAMLADELCERKDG